MNEVQQVKHWTENSPEDFIHKIVGDFVRFIENTMGESVSQIDLAKKIGVSAGRVSQVLNNPGNLSLKTIVEFSRALGAKVSIVGYCDDDPTNANGPISAEVFRGCWTKYGRPHDFFAVSQCNQTFIPTPFMANFGSRDLKIECEETTKPEYMTGVPITTVRTPAVVRGT